MRKNQYEICVFGLGFVGLTTAISFAEKNFKVIGIDKDKKNIENLNNGKISFKEPHLKEKLKKNIKNKRLKLLRKFNFDENKKYVIFICVGTPVKKNSEYDLSSVYEVCSYIKENIKNSCYIFLKSTVLPGTVKYIKKGILRNNQNIHICSNPEFLREGKSWQDFNKADKIVIGADDEDIIKISKILYKNFSGKQIYVNYDTAEFIKQLSNAMLSSLISFSNNFAILAEKLKTINIKASFKAIQLDKRFFGKPAEISSYIYPGIGFGGYCLPKDIEAINKFSEKYNQNSFFNNVIKINDDIFKMHLKKIIQKTNKNTLICIMGLSFKEKTDDIRHSKTIKLAKELLKRNYKKITLCDKYAYNQLSLLFKKNKIKILKKPLYNKNMIYILGQKEKSYINFLKKVPKKQIIDTRYSL